MWVCDLKFEVLGSRPAVVPQIVDLSLICGVWFWAFRPLIVRRFAAPLLPCAPQDLVCTITGLKGGLRRMSGSC